MYQLENKEKFSSYKKISIVIWKKFTMQLKFITIKLHIHIKSKYYHCHFLQFLIAVHCKMYDIQNTNPPIYLKPFLFPHIKERKWRNIIENKNICMSFYKFLFNHNNFFADPPVLLMSMIQQKKGSNLFFTTMYINDTTYQLISY